MIRQKTISQEPGDETTIDRLPPNDVLSEKGILGCCLLDWQQCVPICIEQIGTTGDQFYDLKNAVTWQSICSLYDDQVPVDVITLQERMQVTDTLDQVGGISYLAALPDTVPSAANLSSYLAIVRDKFLLRRMIRVCADASTNLFECDGDVAEALDRVESDVLKVNETNASRDIRPMSELVPMALTSIEETVTNPGAITGIRTGLTDLDRITGGLKEQEMIVIAGRPSMGKAQPLDAKILTPDGFTPMKNIRTGDLVIGSNGKPTRVNGVFPQGEKKVFRVVLSDGKETRCCDEHLWFTQSRNERRRGSAGSVKVTSEILKTTKRGDGGNRNHALPTVRPVEYTPLQNDLPLDPWLLGALLGDGTLKSKSVLFSKPEPDVQKKLISLLPEQDTATVTGMDVRIKRRKKNKEQSETKKAIDALGLSVYSEQKFIPLNYLLASPYQRLELLRGLLDTDGTVAGNSIEYTTSSSTLMKGVESLVLSLGGTCRYTSRIPKYDYKGKKESGLRSYRAIVNFKNGTLPISSQKHLGKYKLTGRRIHRSIVDIIPDGTAQCQCISVDAADGLYVTDNFIVTHNTSLAMNISEYVAVDTGIPTGVFSMEMSDISLTTRLICSRARVSLKDYTDNRVDDEALRRIRLAALQIRKAPIYIDDRGGQSIIQIRAKARRMAQQYGIKLFVIDYLQLANALGNKRRFENRQQEITEISGGCKQLTKDLNVPVIVLSQLNRALERESNRKPRLSDLRESGSIEQDADVVAMLYQPRTSEDDPEPVGDADRQVNLLIAKQRNGARNVDVEFTFRPRFTRFENIARISDEDVPGEDAQQRFA